jgi:phytoene dehydrogenase-like protein
MSSNIDIAIVGGGLNGLVAAAYLAKSGKSVTVFEQSDAVGGTMGTVEIAPGFRGPAALDSIDLVHPSIIQDLNLKKHGLRIIRGGGVTLASDSGTGACFSSATSTADQISGLSQMDEKAFRELDGFLSRIGKALDPVLTAPLKNPKTDGLTGSFDLMKVGWALRKLGKKEMPEALRFLPMTVQDVVDERFESEQVKAMIAATALKGSWLAPRSAGSAYGLLHHNPHWAGGLDRTTTFAEGGPGALADAVASAARAVGATIRTGATVSNIVVERGVCTGLVLSSGEQVSAGRIVSALDPRTTFESMTGQDWLDPEFLERITQIRSHGSVAIVRLALDQAPQFSCAPDGSEAISGRIQIGDSLRYLERAFDAAKYGRIPDAPLLMASIPSILDPTLAPTGKHVMHVWASTMPSKLRDGDWDDQREALGDTVVRMLDQHAPGLAGSVLHRQVETPKDLEKRFGLLNGCIYHTDLALDQLLYMRPVPGWFKYDTPLERLHLCGAGVHPGGAGTGLSGKCAAEHIIRAH